MDNYESLSGSVRRRITLAAIIRAIPRMTALRINPIATTVAAISISPIILFSYSRLLALCLLPFGFSALHFFFGDGERLAHGVVEAFGFRVAGDGRGW